MLCYMYVCMYIYLLVPLRITRLPFRIHIIRLYILLSPVFTFSFPSYIFLIVTSCLTFSLIFYLFFRTPRHARLARFTYLISLSSCFVLIFYFYTCLYIFYTFFSTQSLSPPLLFPLSILRLFLPQYHLPLISFPTLYLAILLYFSSFHPIFGYFGSTSTVISLYHLLYLDWLIFSYLSVSCSFLSSLSIFSYPLLSSYSCPSSSPSILRPCSFTMPLPLSHSDMFSPLSRSLSFISFRHSLAISLPSPFLNFSSYFHALLPALVLILSLSTSSLIMYPGVLQSTPSVHLINMLCYIILSYLFY